MSKLDRADVQAQTDILFADNANGDITEGDFRTQFDNLSDSHVSLIDDYYPRVVSVPTGSGNAITVSTDYPDDYDANIPIWFKATADASAGDVTFKVNSLSALDIYLANETKLSGQITDGLWYMVVWNTSADGSGQDGFVLVQASNIFGASVSAGTGAFDTITDQAGTGAPDFTLGLTASFSNAEKYFTESGSQSTPHNTNTTVKTFGSSDVGVWLGFVSFEDNTSGGVTNLFIVRGSDYNCVQALEQSDGQIDITLSATAFQVYQNTGVTKTLRWSLIKLSSV